MRWSKPRDPLPGEWRIVRRFALIPRHHQATAQVIWLENYLSLELFSDPEMYYELRLQERFRDLVRNWTSGWNPLDWGPDDPAIYARMTENELVKRDRRWIGMKDVIIPKALPSGGRST